MEGVVAMDVRVGERGTVLFDKLSQFLKIAISRSGEDVDHRHLGRVFLGFGVR